MNQAAQTVPNGQYQIVNVNSNACLMPQDRSTAVNTPIIGWNREVNQAEQWEVTWNQISKTYTIQNAATRLYLGTADGIAGIVTTQTAQPLLLQQGTIDASFFIMPVSAGGQVVAMHANSGIIGVACTIEDITDPVVYSSESWIQDWQFCVYSLTTD